MSHADSGSPAWPGPGRPAQRAAFIRAVRAAAERSDWPAVLDALLGVPHDQVPPSLAMPFIVAALHEDRPGAVSAAVSAAVEVDIPPAQRVGLALRLALEGRPGEAWTVLHADPATMTEPAAFPAVVQVLARLAWWPGAAVELRAAAAALSRRYTNRAAVEPVRAPHAFAGGPLDPQPGSGLARILAAPDVPPAVVSAYRDSLARFETTIAGRPRPLVTELHDVFVNRRGQIWLADGKVVEHRSQAVPEASRAAMADAPSVPEAVLAVESHHNIYHWLADWLPSIAWRFEPGAPALPVLVRDDVAPFVTESLRLVAGKGLPILGVGDALRVGRVFLGSFGAASIAPLGAHRRLLESLRGAIDAAPEPPGGTARRLYISRRDSAKRRLGNEEAVEAALAARGFRAVTFTGLPFTTQARLVRGAEVIAAPHGAGLAHLVLARPGTAVFELMPGAVSAAELTTCMARLSRLVGHRHLMWIEARNPLTDAWSANLEAMLPALDAFLREAAAEVR